jgi:hypothetical protein
MKLIDALLNVDKSQSDYVNDEDLFESFGIPYHWDSNVADQLKAYYVIRWCCTDTWVGLRAIYLDDELVGMSTQSARKSNESFKWLSKEAANKVRQLIQPDPAEPDLIDLDEEIQPFYTVAYSSQIIDDEGFYQGRPVKVVRKNNRLDRYAETSVLVTDGQDEFDILTVDFKIPLRTKLTPVTALDGLAIPRH